MLAIKRIYESASQDDGYRVLVDRLWPRGVSKEKAEIDLWMKDIAPSTELRKWFAHDPAKWDEFSARYEDELRNQSEHFDQLKKLEKEHERITLLYAAKDENYNHALVLKELLNAKV